MSSIRATLLRFDEPILVHPCPAANDMVTSLHGEPLNEAAVAVALRWEILREAFPRAGVAFRHFPPIRFCPFCGDRLAERGSENARPFGQLVPDSALRR